MKPGSNAILKRRKRFFTKAKDGTLNSSRWEDVNAETVVKVVEVRQGMFLITHNGLFARVWSDGIRPVTSTTEW